MSDLFGEPALPAGFRYAADVLSPAEEKDLIREPRADAGIPDYLRPLTIIAGQISEMPPDSFEQLMVTEYAAGAGIGWYRDRPTFENIVAVSFLALASCGFAGKQTRIGSVGLPVSSRDGPICSVAPYATAGNIASLQWTCCATP
jgi:hypothetical protein